MTINNPIAG